VLDLVSQVRDVVLMNVYIWIWELRGVGLLGQGVYETGEGNGSKFTSNLGTRWTDPVTARRVPSK
jgi:hypothetical protein